MYLEGRWYRSSWRPGLGAGPTRFPRRELLQKQRLLAPVFGIADPRTSKRVNFVGGIRGTAELEKLVNSGE